MDGGHATACAGRDTVVQAEGILQEAEGRIAGVREGVGMSAPVWHTEQQEGKQSTCMETQTSG